MLKRLDYIYNNPVKVHLFYDAVPCARKVLGSKFITVSSIVMLVLALII
jgi:hypothetical protein